MPDILTDLASPAVTRAIEDSWAAAIDAVARHIPELDTSDTPTRFRFTTGVPFFLLNGVLRARLTMETAEAEIQAAHTHFQSRALPYMWLTGPQTQPADLGGRLATLGLKPLEMAGMAINIDRLPETPTPDDVRLEEVANVESLRAWTQALSEGFELSEQAAEPFAYPAQSAGFDTQGAYRCFLAWQNGKPVACSSLLLTEGVAGIFCVATVEAARGQGIGAVITAMPLRAARQQGYRIGVLQASAMGEPVYRRLGFEERCKVTAYFWTGADASTHAA